MNGLLTGASGYLGRHLYADRLAAGDSLTALGRTAVGASFIPCDLTAEVPDLRGRTFDYVVHSAGWAHSVPRNPADIAACEALNIAGTERLLAGLETADQLPGTVVHISTVLVYGRLTGETLPETTPLTAVDAYGQSKIAAEAVVRAWGQRTGVRTTILRLPLVVADNPQGNLYAMRQAIERGFYVRFGTGAARRSMVLATDVAHVLPMAIQKPGIYNLTDGHHPTVRQLEDAFLRLAGRKRLPVLPLPVARLLAVGGDLINPLLNRRFPLTSSALAKLTQSLTFDDSKARRELGWQPYPVLTFFQ